MFEKKTAIVIMLLGLNVLTALAGDPKSDALMSVLTKLYNNDVYYQYTEYTVDGLSQTQPLISKVWKKGAKVKLENQHTILLMDKQMQINIVHESKTVVIRDLVGTSASKQEVEPNFEGFSMKRLTVNQSTVDFVYTLNKKAVDYQVPFEKAIYRFDEASKQLLSTSFYQKMTSETKQVCDFSGVRFNIKEEPFKGTPLSFIYNDKGEVKREYSGYFIRDLRRKN